ncbi:conserved hypothetical protein [Ricinus communis]|uniref:Uncharacterized protein n=1 Tax=Ricinus communis TaxID=3988 RepID=B9SL01_RICCO|nr:conserved hypothetical protein [Ricinus communis]
MDYGSKLSKIKKSPAENVCPESTRGVHKQQREHLYLVKAFSQKDAHRLLTVRLSSRSPSLHPNLIRPLCSF